MNVDFVPFIRGVRVLCKPRHIFCRINGPIAALNKKFLKKIGEPQDKGYIFQNLKNVDTRRHVPANTATFIWNPLRSLRA